MSEALKFFRNAFGYFSRPENKKDQTSGEDDLKVFNLAQRNPDIEIRNLNISINGNHILKNVSTTIPDKKITCIIGPSGCGKTTLLKSINRLLDNTQGVKIDGTVIVDGENIYDSKTEITHVRTKLGLLSQRPTPLPMSIYDNIAFGVKLHEKKKKKELNAIVEKQLKAAGLWEEVKNRLHSPAAALSIGQQQRLCLARGLAIQPQFILGDEATSALDPISSKHIEKLFMELREQYGIILVTHTLRQALRIADHVVFMYLGEVIEEGPAEQLFNHPKHELTKQYLSGEFS